MPNGSGTGFRTLNLAVGRSLRPVPKSWSEFADCRLVPPKAKVCHPGCRTNQRPPTLYVPAALHRGLSSPRSTSASWPS